MFTICYHGWAHSVQWHACLLKGQQRQNMSSSNWVVAIWQTCLRLHIAIVCYVYGHVGATVQLASQTLRLPFRRRVPNAMLTSTRELVACECPTRVKVLFHIGWNLRCLTSNPDRPARTAACREMKSYLRPPTPLKAKSASGSGGTIWQISQKMLVRTQSRTVGSCITSYAVCMHMSRKMLLSAWTC